MGSTVNMMNLGDDQLASQYSIEFPEGIPGGGDTNSITLRMDQQFDPPEDNVATYDIIYRGMKVTKTSMTHEMSKEVPILVRIDQQWKVHDDLVAWAKLCYDPVTGTALPDAATRTTLLIHMYDGQGAIVKTYRYRGAKLKGYKIETLDNQSTDPLRMTLNFIFNDQIPE